MFGINSTQCILASSTVGVASHNTFSNLNFCSVITVTVIHFNDFDIAISILFTCYKTCCIANYAFPISHRIPHYASHRHLSHPPYDVAKEFHVMFTWCFSCWSLGVLRQQSCTYFWTVMLAHQTRLKDFFVVVTNLSSNQSM